jgi:hypothetical protein
MKNTLKHLITAAVVFAGIAGTSLKAAETLSPLSKLIAEAQTNSSQISTDWKAYVRRPNLNTTNDAAEIARMKEDINAEVKTITILTDSRSQASASQGATIDQLVPIMEELVDNAADALDYLNGNESRLTEKECKEYLQDSSDTTTRLATLIAQIVELGNGRDKFESAKREMELSAINQ